MSKQIQNLETTLTTLRKKVFNYATLPLERLSENQKFWIGFALLCLITTFLINNPFLRIANEQYKEGDIAHESIISPADITVIDETETETIKQTIRESIRPIFTFEAKRADEAVQSFRAAWESLAKKTSNSNSNAQTETNVKSEVQWAGAGGAELGKAFTARRFSPNELEAITRVLRENAEGSIYGDQDRQYFQEEITLVDRQKPNQQLVVKLPESGMTALSEARNNLKSGLKQIKSLSETEVEAFNAALAPLVQPSIAFDSVATNNARDAETKSVEPVKISLKRGQTIVREGDTITGNILSQISAIRSYSSSKRQWNRFFGLLAIITALFWVAWKFIQHRGIVPRLVLSEQKTFALFGFVVLVQTAIMAVFFRLAEFTLSQPTIGNNCGRFDWFIERLGCGRSNRLYSTTIYSQHGSLGNRLRSG
ncbi:MAG: hypothetical protein LC778_07430 [Acidobacteria bacterium]|nr:hypothetical protein [Acidobacteriota bacterium]